MFNLLWKSVLYYKRVHLSVFIGTVLTSLVLTGALLVGDSVDYSLRKSATLRLGNIHYVLGARDQLISQELAENLSAHLERPVAAILQLPGMAIHQGTTSEERLQVNQVNLLGIDGEFWKFTDGFALDLGPNETALNTKLASALGVNIGDELSMRVTNPSLMARDAPLSWRSEEPTKRRRYTLKAIVPDDAVGQFNLSPSQIVPYNAFVNRAFLQEQIELPERINLMIAGEGITLSQLESALDEVGQPEDLGLTFRTHSSGVVQLESERIFFDDETARLAFEQPEASGTLTYLVNTIGIEDRLTPYSFVLAGSVPSDLKDNEIIINEWVAEEIEAKVGDTVTLAYYQLLVTNDFVEEKREFVVKSIRTMDSLIPEKELMPHFPGLSDVESCADWDVGMPMDEALLEDEGNEEYWDVYRQTPKAMVTLAVGQEMWRNRFGDLTAIQIPGGESEAATFRETFQSRMDMTRMGLEFMPVKENAEKAVDEALDFGGLFLGMSFFLIGSALMLTSMLFTFGIQQRSSEMGTLLALGYKPQHVRNLLIGEGMMIAVPAALFGAVVGSFYTRVLLYGLAQYWEGAVASASIEYHGKTGTLILGATVSMACAFATMGWFVSRYSKNQAVGLLHGDVSQDIQGKKSWFSGRLIGNSSLAGIVLALVIMVYASMSQMMEITYAYFAAGSLLLISALGLFRYALFTIQNRPSATPIGLFSLALQNLTRRKGRSLAVVASLACGSFMVFSVSSMQTDLEAQSHLRASGTGGFALIAQATLPILDDPLEQLVSKDVSGTKIKVRDGDDASCLNLNRAQSPQLLGVHLEDFVERGAFTKTPDENAFSLLDLDLDEGMIPAIVGDSNTAMFNLKKKTGVKNGDVLLYQDESGNEVKVKLVGTIPTRLSVFQGSILISDESFTRIFPSEDGYRMFLIDAPDDLESGVISELKKDYDRFGLDVVTTLTRLKDFYTVESTYLAMFLVLGGIGLMLGTVGLAVVVLRNIYERRSELALLQAVGFNKRDLIRLIGMEYGCLVAAGLIIGSLTALVSMIPALAATATSVEVGIQVKILCFVVVLAVGCTILAVLTGIRRIDNQSLQYE
jgi:ABC-type antimicrobial peptide transport system permease subunit